MIEIPIETSGRHVHLAKKDLEKLFGKGHELKKMKKLFQPSDFAARETVDIEGENGRILKLRVIGPVRSRTQVELSKTDAIYLGITAPVRESGNIKETPGAVLRGPENKIRIKEGIINSQRHIHCSFARAKKLGLKDRMMVSVETDGPVAVTFHNVLVRLGENYRLCVHLDTDEGNAAGIIRKGKGKIIINNI
ncbi:MAG: phosphate propanoyltransferase [Candidatus Staskawiczbacteria bacterium]|nr:phosphate propanoyltransferase [Candidatus Staskawiczbacteria bacterium]